MALIKVSEENIQREKNALFTLEEVNSRKGYLITKRYMDVIGALVGLILLSPVFLIIALLIKYEDPKGTVLFKQVRIGKGGKEFYMYKFRSMVTDAEEKLKDLLEYNEVSGAMFKMKEDPRITKIGKFIRRTSMDELPQLINVLQGEMSLVGPRPPLLREVKEYTSYDKQRLLVTPGCTGLWQVSGRSNLSFEQMVELDVYYIIQRNIMFDIKILLRTVKVLLKSNDAY
ncbi:sugar transferase [Bacillus wiedmannii]|uniref:Sugar transferase n=1 Tax=Bacillus wiedmannii TaxID=1890302 RepID=A0A2B5J4N7_9BACI|nr:MULTISPECIES: sugar transferase [Bacillus cereus group]EJQ41422.1 exopolysaccharide biosynthesis polyprenyl glycosylphosphotransferase [Bacillus wiedmannii]KAA0776562.1 sugar transferase [Bacillus sp. BB51/4]OAK32931.1 multidrug MFS transporter [Bacillus wiedmannii]PEI71233.1 sugar transferase [Bacillus wiedmannii]PEN03971.1 sugar transferase [Bacillus wiedmannii]